LFELSNIREGNNTLAGTRLNKLFSAELRFSNCFVFLAALAQASLACATTTAATAMVCGKRLD
jgi:hypothetical protein